MHLLLTLLAVMAPVVGLTPAEVDAALRGQVPVRIEPVAGGKAGLGIGAIVVERPVGEVWNTISRFEDKVEYMPRLKSLSILEQSPEQVRVVMTVDASVTKIHYTMLFRRDSPAYTLSWKLDYTAPDNGIADSEGEYRLYAVDPARTLVTYKSFVNTGRSVPRFIQDYMAKRSIPDLLHAIKKRVESGGLWKK